MLAALRLRRPRRFACAICHNTFVERGAWREPGFAHTLRYAQHIYTRTQHEDIAQVALDEGLSQDTVRSIFERWAKKRSTSAATRL
jgi:transposase